MHSRLPLTNHTQQCDVYFASTPLHLVFAIALAMTMQRSLGAKSVLVCIDQQPGSNNPYLSILEGVSTHPFSKIVRLDRHTHWHNKLLTRRQNFHCVRQLIDLYQPDRIFTGSDRRIEFQCAMARACKYKSVQGIYVDEGTYSYIARAASRSFSDRYLDNGVKKLVYGRWWSNPPTTGAGKWIDECWLFFPQHAHSLLQKKYTKELDRSLLRQPAIRTFFAHIISNQGVDTTQLYQASHILTLPHHSLVGDGKAYSNLVMQLSNMGARVALKYHPRSQITDYPASVVACASTCAWCTLAGPLLFEALLAFLSPKTTLIGDISSTLLIAKWLSPQTKVVAIQSASHTAITTYQTFLREIGIDVLPLAHIVKALA